MYKKEIRVRMKHKLDFNDKNLMEFYTNLKSYSDETTLKNEHIFIIHEEKAFFLNKEFVDFRFYNTLEGQENFINDIIKIIEPNLVIDEIIFHYLEEKPLENKNFNKFFVNIRENIEVELLGFKIIEENKAFYISLVKKSEEENTKRLIIKTKIKDVTTSNITNELKRAIKIISDNVMKSIDEFIKE